jgi:hypothetical protein
MNIEFIPYLGIFLFLITSAIIVAKIIMEMRDETREEIKYLRVRLGRLDKLGRQIEELQHEIDYHLHNNYDKNNLPRDYFGEGSFVFHPCHKWDESSKNEQTENCPYCKTPGSGLTCEKCGAPLTNSIRIWSGQ